MKKNLIFILILIFLYLIIFMCYCMGVGWHRAKDIIFYSYRYSIGDEIIIRGNNLIDLTDYIINPIEKYGFDNIPLVQFRGNITSNPSRNYNFLNYIPAYEFISIEQDYYILKIPEGAISGKILILDNTPYDMYTEQEIIIKPLEKPNFINFIPDEGKTYDIITIEGINFFDIYTLKRCLRYYYGEEINIDDRRTAIMYNDLDLIDEDGKCDFVTFGDVPVKEYISVEKNKVIVKIPEGAKTGKIKIYNMYEGGESKEDFVINE